MKTSAGQGGGAIDRVHVSSCHWQQLKNHHHRHKSDTKEGGSKGLQLPRSRQRHSACRVGEFVYVFCGKDGTSPLKDIWKYHIYNQTWELVEMRGGSLPLLQGHTAVAYKRLIMIFGGTFNNNVNDIQLWIFNTDLGHLREVWGEPGSTQPLCRRDHSAVVHNNLMYVFGGFKDPTGASQELWAFNIDEEEWTELTHLSHLKPSGRYGHSAVVADNAMWIFGGTAGLAPCTDFWKYSFSLHQWTKLKCVGGPPSLSGHSMCVIHCQMVVVGGNCKGKPMNDVWTYRFDTNTWQKLTCRGMPLPAVSFHTCVSVSAPDSKHQPSTDRTLSTPHLKPSTTLLHPDRFVVRPRTSPSVLEETASSGASSESSERSGTQETQVMSLEEADSPVVDLRNTNSSHRADTRIDVSLKEPLVSDSPEIAGVYESCFPFSPRCNGETEQELQVLQRGSDSNSLMPGQTGTHTHEGTHKSVTLDLIDLADSPVLKASKHGVNSSVKRTEITFWNDLFIEDLELSDDGGLDEVKISYPSKHPMLPLSCPVTTDANCVVIVEDTSTQQWRNDNTDQKQRNDSLQSQHRSASSYSEDQCQIKEFEQLTLGGRDVNSTQLSKSVPDLVQAVRPRLHSQTRCRQGDFAKPGVPCKLLNQNLPSNREESVLVPSLEIRPSQGNKDIPRLPSHAQSDRDINRGVLDCELDSFEAETSFIDGGDSAQVLPRGSSGISLHGSSGKTFGSAGNPFLASASLPQPKGRGEASRFSDQRSTGVDGAKEEMTLEEPFVLVLGGKMEEQVSIMPKPIAVWKAMFV